MTKEEMQEQINDLQRECNEKQNHIRKLYACEPNDTFQKDRNVFWKNRGQDACFKRAANNHSIQSRSG